MVQSRSSVLLIAAAIVFVIAAMLAFGIIVDTATVLEVLGTVSIGSLLFVLAHLP